jgi:SET domain
MNYRQILARTKDKDNLKVTLKETREKGVGLFAAKEIKDGEIIAFYKIKIFRKKGYKSPTNFTYSFEIYRKNGKAYKTLIGDLDKDSFPKVVDNIAFWAPFANEPTKDEMVNSEIEIDLKGNYAHRKYSSPGETMIYKLIATKEIELDEEILWFYGEDYERNYEIGKY